jgi:hypothetical protein
LYLSLRSVDSIGGIACEHSGIHLTRNIRVARRRLVPEGRMHEPLTPVPSSATSVTLALAITQQKLEKPMSDLTDGRRTFLARAGVLTVGIGVGGLLSRSALAAASPSSSDVGVVQTALAIEHEGIAAYQIAGKSGLLSPGTLKLALIFMGHHQAHRDSLAKLVIQAGGKPVEPKTDAQYIAELKLGDLKSEGDVIALATTLERGAASAYIGQVTALHDPRLAKLFASISADEAIHWTTLNNAAGTPIPTAAYVFG